MSSSALSNSFWYMTTNVARLIVSLIGTIIITRNLGTDLFGQFSYVFSFFLITYSFDSLCNPTEIKRLVLIPEIDEKLVVGSAISLSFLVVSFYIILFLLVGYFYIQDGDQFLILVILLLASITKPLNVISTFYDAKLKSVLSGTVLLVGVTLSILYRVYFSIESKSIVQQGVGFTFQIIVTMFLLLFLYRTNIRATSFSSDIFKKIFSRSLPLFWGALFTSLLLRVDAIMIMDYIGAEEVGVYSVMLKMCEPLVIVCTAVGTSVFPLLVKSKIENIKRYKEILLGVNSLLIYASVFMGIVGVALSDFAVRMLFGDEYIGAASYFKVYYWTTTFLFLSNIQHLWESIEGRNNHYLLRTFVASIANITLNLILIPKYGSYGAAVATLIAFATLILTNLFFSDTRGYILIQIKSINPMWIIRLANVYRRRV